MGLVEKAIAGVKAYFIGEYLEETTNSLERDRIKMFYWYCIFSIIPLIVFLPFLVYGDSLVQAGFVSIYMLYLIANLFFLKINKEYKGLLKFLAIISPLLVWSLIVVLMPSDFSIFITLIYIVSSLIIFTLDKRWIYALFVLTIVSIGWAAYFKSLGYLPGELLGISMVDQTELGYSTMIKIGAPMLILFLALDNFVRINNASHKELNESNERQLRLNKELLDSRKQYKALVEGARELVYELNSEGQFEYINPAFKELTGYGPEFIKGISYDYLIHPKAKEEGKKFFENRKLKNVERSYEEFPILTKEGKIVWIGQNTRVVEDEEGNQKKYFCIGRDITMEKRLKQNLLSAKENAEKASLLKTQFLSAMSHEIRTPINAVLGTIHLMEQEDPREDQVNHIETLKYSAEGLMNLVTHLLDFNELDSNGVKISESSFNLKDLVNEACKKYRRLAEEKDLLFSLIVDEKVPEKIKGDSIRISQIISNLLDNAVKFTNGGFVRFKVSVLRRKENYAKILFSIEDSGKGISQDKIDHIFEKFTQGHDETILEGTGLGLAISKKIAALMGSEIKVESTLDVGSNFSFILDLETISKAPSVQETPQVKIQKTKSELANSLNGIKVLLVEDNLINQKVASKLLSKWGAAHVIAPNGKIALEKVQKEKFDLVLMDIQMPVMDGIEATKQIRSLGGVFEKLPIIALTASAVLEVRQNAMAAGLDEFVTKPFNPGKLNKTIQKFVFSEVVLNAN